MAGKLIVRQVRSTISRPEKQRLVLRALGLRRIGHQREHEDNPVIRGMIRKVSHLVEVREANEG
jgi:large subunit ribosomal protein L30